MSEKQNPSPVSESAPSGPFRVAEFATITGRAWHVAADDLEIDAGTFDALVYAEEQCYLLNVACAAAVARLEAENADLKRRLDEHDEH